MQVEILPIVAIVAINEVALPFYFYFFQHGLELKTPADIDFTGNFRRFRFLVTQPVLEHMNQTVKENNRGRAFIATALSSGLFLLLSHFIQLEHGILESTSLGLAFASVVNFALSIDPKCPDLSSPLLAANDLLSFLHIVKPISEE